MDYTHFEGISDIQTTSFDFNHTPSNLSHPKSNNVAFSYSNSRNFGNDLSFTIENGKTHQNQPSFYSMRQYVQNTLKTWGFELGYLSESTDNLKTMKCLMDIIAQRYKDIEQRQKYKDKLNQVEFEKNKYRSMLEQQKKTLVQKNKQLGKLENSYQDLKTKMKNLESQSKKEKDDDKKAIMMLKGKNEQIMHEVKKREQEVNKIKEQMKKNVGEKNGTKALNFEVYEIGQSKKSSEEDDRATLLSQRFQSQKGIFLKENLLVKEKLYDIRQEIVSFAEWIDQHVYREKNPSYKNSFIVNHNLLFRKESIVDELKDVIESAKDGIVQILQMKKNIGEQLKLSQQKKRLSKSPPIIPQSPRSGLGSPRRSKIADNKQFRKKDSVKLNSKEKNLYWTANLPKQGLKTPRKMEQSRKSQITAKKEDSIIFAEEESELSIISHISMSEIEKHEPQVDKWNSLLKE